jgi:hypothetical protein
MVLLLVLPVLLLVAILALSAAELTEAGTDARVSADAAALAGAQVLVDDAFLRGKRSDLLHLLAEATSEVQRYGGLNPVLGMPLEFQENPRNDPDGDIVFGFIDNLKDRTMVVADLSGTGQHDRGNHDHGQHNHGQNDDGEHDNGRHDHGWPHGKPGLHQINAVRVQSRRGTRILRGPYLARWYTEVHPIATAYLDHDVIGFRPHHRTHCIPLAPFALRSDPTGSEKKCWERHVEKRGNKDQWHWDRGRRQVVPGGDGLFEMTVSGDNGCLLQLGTNSLTALAQQLLVGVTADDLENFGRQLVLSGNNNTLIVPGTPWKHRSDDAGCQYLLQILRQLQSQGEPRVWPLYAGFDPEKQMPILRGFVAARVAEVTVDLDDSKTSFTLQPCKMSLGCAVTDASRRGHGVPNRYLCKVRLVE